ncbi:MAG: glucose-1-phosphate adenylyltransferase subunit GlgD [Clostridia bacterium]|nr:glucose-1-phosphate adenylyltransferase subunit GlgD [Clostridia bacterium]MBR5278062.1 glucose-1-phosphate adenylyltransferase subunit GlgD [Clostridia bacterium]
MNAVGIIFSSINEKSVYELTKQRTMASVPFGCRYRLIDFALSNMVNSDITHVGIITHYNYQSLMDHIDTGKDWDLARRHGGVKILPPYITAFANNSNYLYSTRLEALISIRDFIADCKEDVVVLSDCDTVCNLDLSAMVEQHIASGADITLGVKSSYVAQDTTRAITIVNSDDNGKVTEVVDYSGMRDGFEDVYIRVLCIGKKYLEELITDAMAHGYTSFTKDILIRNYQRHDCRVFKFDGYLATIRSMTDYFRCSMDMLDPEIRRSIFGVRNRPVFTKVRNSSPASYTDGAIVRNSLIADGCVIQGTVENSILFRGVKVGKNTHIKNSIIMQDTITGENVYLNCVVTDKNVVIRDGRVLSGHETRPFFIDKGSNV